MPGGVYSRGDLPASLILTERAGVVCRSERS